MDRRSTLGVLSQSAMNSKSGASRVSVIEQHVTKAPPRMSVAPMNISRKSSLSIMPIGARKSSLSIMPRQSTSIQPRPSTSAASMSINPRSEDPRNITDKSFIGSSVRVLLDYLTEHNYPHPISPKILTRPSSKDFNNIILFLFLQIDSNFKLSGKFEDEVISMFKQLKYPYPISKTSLVAVGTPHTWPALLATIMWLIELLSYDEEVITASQRCEEADLDDPSASEKAFFKYLSTAYQLFLSGDDAAYDQLEEQFLGSFEVKNNSILNQIQSIKERNISLEAEIADVEGRRAHLPELQHKRTDYVKDIDKFKSLIQQLQKHKEQLEIKSRDRRTELSKLEAATQSILVEIEGLKQNIATQELSPDDVRRMMEERERLENTLESTIEGKTATQKRVWEAEDKLRERVQALEDSGRNYYAVAEDLKLVPKTARNAHNRDLTIEIDIRAKKKSDVLKGDIRGLIIPTFREIRVELSGALDSARRELLTTQDQIEESDLRIEEAAQEKQILEARLRRSEDSYRREKDALEKAVSSYAFEVDAVETKLIRLRDTASVDARINIANRRISEVHSTRQLRLLEHKRQTREMIDDIMEAVSQCASHREVVQDKLAGMVASYRHRLEKLLTSTGPADMSSYTPRMLTTTKGRSTLKLTTNKSKCFDDESVDDGEKSAMALRGPFENISPIEATKYGGDQDGMESYMSQDTGVGDSVLMAANISRAAPEMDPSRVISNLAGLIDICAANDRNLLDDSASAVEI